jgi:hypothetical protein|tara:strand:- start:216 stop:797 length:582 start_codon:yes stop_codon:yes gene_type:complete
MHYRYHSAIPERMVVLSLLSPPNSYEPRAPFGYGALIVSRRWRGEAAFSSHAHGYGAGYDPQRMRDAIRKLFTPESKALIHVPAPPHAPKYVTERMPFPAEYLDYVPRSGLVANIHARIPHDQLVDAARIGGLEVYGSDPSPLQRIARIGTEAQAAWVCWMFGTCSPRMRRELLASHTAWRALERASGRLTPA